MIGDVDRTLEKLLQANFGKPLPFDLSFAPPDKNFRPVSNSKNTLNCYLYDIREARDLRDIQPTFTPKADGSLERSDPPARVKLSYCITAWSPAELTPATEPAVDEHALLGSVLAALLRYPTLPEPVLAGALAGQLLPPPSTTIILPAEHKVTADFWNALGGQLRPWLDYSVTISLVYQPPSSGPMVTAAQMSFAEGEGWYMIGGVVRDQAAPGDGLEGAWVRVPETGKTYVAGPGGRFLIDAIAAGNYTFLVRAVGFQDGSRSIAVPQPDGLYDVQLVHL